MTIKTNAVLAARLVELFSGLDLDDAQRDLLVAQVQDAVDLHQLRTLTIPPDATLPDVFKAFETWATCQGYEVGGEFRSRHVWNILTALRGPDGQDPDNSLKYATTARIRNVVFPELASQVSATISLGQVADIDPVRAHSTGAHFGRHVMWAVKAIQAFYPKPVLEQLRELLSGRTTTLTDIRTFLALNADLMSTDDGHAAEALLQEWTEAHWSEAIAALYL